MMGIISRTDFILRQFAFKTKKILVHIKLTKHRLRKLFLFLRLRESECLELVNSPNRARSLFMKDLLTETQIGKVYYHKKNSTSAGKNNFQIGVSGFKIRNLYLKVNKHQDFSVTLRT